MDHYGYAEHGDPSDEAYGKAVEAPRFADDLEDERTSRLSPVERLFALVGKREKEAQATEGSRDNRQ